MIDKNAARKLNVYTLVLKDESYKRYSMRYDAVVLYTNKHDTKMSQFHLPSEPPTNSARGWSVAVARASSRPSRTPVRRRMVRVPPELPPRLLYSPEPSGYDYDSDSEANDNPEVKDVKEAEDKYPWLVGYTEPNE